MLTFMQAIAVKKDSTPPAHCPTAATTPATLKTARSPRPMERCPLTEPLRAFPRCGHRLCRDARAPQSELPRSHRLPGPEQVGPAVENATNAYIDNVCTWTGLTPTRSLPRS